MKIFFDDIRPLPKDAREMSLVRTFESCVSLLNLFKNEIDFIDLDYDLGYEKTGLDVLIYMKENNIKPNSINIHSDHPAGKREMIKYAEENFSDSSITVNKYRF